jgi:predicted ribosome quality control (RQC) complex YloA/Tae2 family protein
MLSFEIYIPSLKSNITFDVGQNAKENFDLIDAAHIEDHWFHVEGLPSGHVIAHTSHVSDRTILNKIVKQGALLCKQQSKYSAQKNLEIVYTRVKNVEKTNIIGNVILQESKKIFI